MSVSLADRALLANVRPAGWVNPTPARRYNLAVIGAGTAGLVCAAGAAGLGAKVALVERGRLGGDCLNAGCVPSKALLRSGRAAADVRGAGRYGVDVPAGARVDFPAVMERMRRLRAEISTADSVWRLRDLGVDVFLGAARFTGRDRVEVDGRTLCFRRAVIATGARAAAPLVPGLAEAGYLTNETVFDLTELPRRLAVIGGGPIGCELSQAFARFGSEVTLVELGPRLLPRDDPDAAEIVRRALAADGIHVAVEAKVRHARRDGSDIVLDVGRAGRDESVRVDRVLVGVGRAPNVEGLGLDAAGVAYDARRGVVVDDRLRTTNRAIFAAGDVCSPWKFTHNSDVQARVVLVNALFAGRARASALTIPWCTYTDPEVARVGLDAGQADARGLAVRTFTQPLASVDRAVLDGETEGFVRIHVRAGTDRIVGATIVARHAGEMLPELTLAVTHGVGLRAIGRTVHTYPTQAEAIRRLGDAHERTRLTPRVRRLFATWFAWRR